MSNVPPYTPQDPNYAYAAPHGAPADEPRNRGALVIGIALAIVLLIALLTGAFLIGRSGQATDAQSAIATSGSTRTTVAPTTTAAGATTTAPETTVAVDPTIAPVTAPTGNGGPAPTVAPKPTTAPTNPPAPTAPKPVITSFTTPENIDCHNGNFQTFSASWTTTNATKTTISIDGPGVYKTYGPNDSDSLPFNCSTPHTFLLTAYGQDGSTTTKSITLMPRNVQAPASPDDDQ
jgi:hypothetical protein